MDQARRPSKESTRREEILAVSAAVFARDGVAGATVRTIARECGIMSGSLYHHFDTKDQILAEVLLPVMEDVTEEYRYVLAKGLDPVETMRLLILAAVTEASNRPDPARILHNDANHLRGIPALTSAVEARRWSHEQFSTVVRNGVAAGVFRADLDVMFAMGHLFDGILGSARWFAPVRRCTPEHVADQLWRMFVDGIRA